MIMHKFLLVACATLLTGGVAQAHCPRPCESYQSTCEDVVDDVVGDVGVAVPAAPALAVPVFGLSGYGLTPGMDRRWDRRFDRHDRRWDRREDRWDRRWDRRDDRWDRRFDRHERRWDW